MPCKKYCQTVIMDRRPILFGLGIVTAGIIAGCFLQYRNETTNKECTRQLFAMDTVMSFTAYGKNSEQAVDAAMKEVQRLDEEAIPAPFRGAPIVLLCAALMSIAFMGFSGL